LKLPPWLKRRFRGYFNNINLNNIDKLTASISQKAEQANLEMANSFHFFQVFVVISLIYLVIFVIIVGYVTARSIVLPVHRLKEFLITMTKGVLPKDKLETKN
jgi:nitrate/nitrite-specific signal transduction histidine kinase